MYKVLIVDDEKIIRMGIKNIIPWNAIGFQEVFAAASGNEALRIIEEHKPDVMITDIQMTEMTGLQLIEQVKAIKSDMRIVVLTGYDSFDYARECLRMQVVDFLLKPIDEDLLTQLMKDQVEYLDQKNQEIKLASRMQRTQGASAQMQLEEYMRDLVHNRLADPAGFQNLLMENRYAEDQKMQIVILVPTLYADNKDISENFRAMSIKNICIGMVDAREEGITFMDDDGKIILAYFSGEQADETVERVEQLNHILKDEFNSMPKAVIGSSVDGFKNLYVSYNDAKYLLEHEKENIHEIIQSYNAQSRVSMFQQIYMELKNVMTANVGNSDYVLKAFQTFCKATESYNLSSAYVRRCCFEIASVLYFSYISDSGEATDSKINALLQSLLHAQREEACEITRNYIVQLFSKEELNIHEIVSKAKKYIDQYLGEELSVANIAAGLYITPNYFSRLFKKVCGEGCNEYIVRKRIEKAKFLLETSNMKTGKIAMLVGYRDTNYFSLAFKKHAGVSPTKYRENVRE